MDSITSVGCRSGRAIAREDLPSWIRVDEKGNVWTSHNGGGYDAPERRAERHHVRGYLTVKIPAMKNALAHRIVYAWHYGEAPAGVLIRHLNDNRTDNRPCNLALGSAQDNADDMKRNGGRTVQHLTGEHNTNAKMTAETVREMRRLYKAGAKQVPLARQFGISQASSWAIVNYKTWRHVPD